MTAGALLRVCEDLVIKHSGEPEDTIVMHIEGPSGSDKMPVVEVRGDRTVYGLTLAKCRGLLERAHAAAALTTTDAEPS